LSRKRSRSRKIIEVETQIREGKENEINWAVKVKDKEWKQVDKVADGAIGEEVHIVEIEIIRDERRGDHEEISVRHAADEVIIYSEE